MTDPFSKLNLLVVENTNSTRYPAKNHINNILTHTRKTIKVLTNYKIVHSSYIFTLNCFVNFIHLGQFNIAM